MRHGWSMMLAAGLSVSPPAQAAGAEGTGVYPAIMEEVASLPAHVVYRPQNMAAVPRGSLGVYIFGNGGCSADGTASRNHLIEIASHGYIAIAPGTIPPPGAPPEPPRQPGPLPAPTKAQALTEAIDWAIRENGKKGSALYGKIGAGRIAISGWSCGGLQALSIAADPRAKTIIVMNSGIYNDGQEHIVGMKSDKAMLKAVHGSALYVMGGPTDVAYANGVDDYHRLTHVPAALINIPVGHGGTYRAPNGGLGARVVTSWLDWQLKGKAAAGRMFRGKDCGWCGDTGLTIETRGLK